MTDQTRRQFATGVMWGCWTFNWLIFAAAVMAGQYGASVASSLVLVAVSTWLWFAPKVGRLLDASLAEARARQTTAEYARDVIEREMQAGAVGQVRVSGIVPRGKGPRVN